MNHFEATARPADFNFGRKGVAYDWPSLFASAAASTLEHELATLAPATFATSGALDAG